MGALLALGAACQPFSGDDGPASPPLDGGADGDGGSVIGDAGGPTDTADARPPSYRDVVLADQPIAYFRLGEASGGTGMRSEVDPSHLLTLEGVSAGQPGAIADDTDTSVLLSETGARLESNSADLFMFEGRAPFSLEVWFRATTIDTTERYLISRASENETGYGIFLKTPTDKDTGLVFERRVGGNRTYAAYTPTSIPTNEWHHAVAAYDGVAMEIYFDGERRKVYPDDRELPKVAEPLFLGAKASGGGSFQGGLDEVAVYDHALTPDRVRLHWNVGSGAQGDR